MLRARVLTALVLLLALAVLLWSGRPELVQGTIALFLLVGGWEWARLAGLATPRREVYVVALGGAAALVVWRGGIVLWVCLFAGALWWLWLMVGLSRFRAVAGDASGPWLIAGGLTLVPAGVALSDLYSADPAQPARLLYLLLVVWTADTAAFFAGRAWGRRKLAPQLSPGKSIEGAIAGLLAVAGLAWLASWVGPSLVVGWLPGWVLLAIVIAGFSILGDLQVSALKRAAGAKDSGQLLPGHGGVLDRIDSLTAAAPMFAVGLGMLGFFTA
ncbi:MAG: phosphatidate cytidylyltransferase [Gammaproteobacteria bacterium]|jgi:phosphatidate cytidylyltransferase|nr:phosphatidate cytidylyltransferase [Gammaproteobacteria bacterium]